MFHYRRFVLDIGIGEGMGATGRTKQQAVALAMVTGTFGTGRNFHQATIAVLAMSGGDPLRDDRTAAGTLSNVDYLMVSMLPILLTKLTTAISIDLFEWKHLMVSKNNILQVMAEPVSTCVQEILLPSPLHSPRLVTKL